MRVVVPEVVADDVSVLDAVRDSVVVKVVDSDEDAVDEAVEVCEDVSVLD